MLLHRHKSKNGETPFDTYFREIDETRLLTSQEEKELAQRVEGGDQEARDRMVRANLRLVVNIARGYLGRGLPLQDLIAEGNLGLMRAVEGFDPRMNTRFSTYASFWIKQSMKRAILNTAKTVRLPSYMVDLLTKWRRAAAELKERLRRTPTEAEIAGSLGLPKKKLAIIKRAIRIQNAAGQNDDPVSGQSFIETVMDDRSKAPDALYGAADNMLQVMRHLDKLDEREAAVLRMRFGLDSKEPMTLKDIGTHLGLTRERVRQIEREALNNLRSCLAE